MNINTNRDMNVSVCANTQRQVSDKDRFLSTVRRVCRDTCASCLSKLPAKQCKSAPQPSPSHARLVTSHTYLYSLFFLPLMGCCFSSSFCLFFPLRHVPHFLSLRLSQQVETVSRMSFFSAADLPFSFFPTTQGS